MRRLLPFLTAAVVWMGAGAACAPSVDLKTAIKPAETLSGWYDDGVTPDGLNRLLPSITFRLKNESDRPLSNVDVMVAFWVIDGDGEKDSKQIVGIGSTALAPGAMTEPITVRSSVGYTLAQPRAELFTHSMFKDFVAKLFAKRGGNLVAIGDVAIDRRLLPYVPRTPGRP
jgi:hypothetical protein